MRLSFLPRCVARVGTCWLTCCGRVGGAGGAVDRRWLWWWWWDVDIEVVLMSDWCARRTLSFAKFGWGDTSF